MNIALPATLGVWSSLRNLLRGFAPGAAPVLRGNALPARSLHGLASAPASERCMAPTRPHSAMRTPHRPLRVVRILETGQVPTQVGRMVISGRMADVCAELDRLAACEAART